MRNFRAEADGEGLGMHAEPAADPIMAHLMDEDERPDDDQEGEDRENEAREEFIQSVLRPAGL